jgi:hypothetical protein
MCPTDLINQYFSHAEKMRQLRLQLAETTDELERQKRLKQIEELEEASKYLKP